MVNEDDQGKAGQQVRTAGEHFVLAAKICSLSCLAGCRQRGPVTQASPGLDWSGFAANWLCDSGQVIYQGSEMSWGLPELPSCMVRKLQGRQGGRAQAPGAKTELCAPGGGGLSVNIPPPLPSGPYY